MDPRQAGPEGRAGRGPEGRGDAGPGRGGLLRRAATARRVGPALPALLLLAACATTGSLREQRGQGLTRFYEAPFQQIWEAAVHAVEANGLRLDLTDRSERFIAATHLPPDDRLGPPDESVSVSADQGERIGIFVDSVAPGTWGVEVVTRRRFALDPTAQDWTGAIFAALERELGDGVRVPGPGPPEATPEGDTGR